MLAQDPVVSLSLCDRLKPVLGSGGSLLLQLRDGAQVVWEVDWFVAAVLSVSDDADAARLPREEDLEVDDELPMADEDELLKWGVDDWGVTKLPIADKDGWACLDFVKVAANDGTVTGFLLASCFSWGTCLLLYEGKEQ